MRYVRLSKERGTDADFDELGGAVEERALGGLKSEVFEDEHE